MAGLENLTGTGDDRGEIAEAAASIRKLADARRPPRARRVAEGAQEHRRDPSQLIFGH